MLFDSSCDDTLRVWQSLTDVFAHLRKLSQIFLAISITGLIANFKETMLSSRNVQKIQMIHDNYNLLEKI
jgi:hypothetical protein